MDTTLIKLNETRAFLVNELIKTQCNKKKMQIRLNLLKTINMIIKHERKQLK